MIHYVTVYMNERDITHWVAGLDIFQPRSTIYRQFDVTLAGWHFLEYYQTGARWDIYASHDADDPRAESLIRAGVVPPDRERAMLVQSQAVPTVTLRGYDNIWIAQRRRPSDTLVVVPGAGFGDGSVEAALERYDGPVGRYTVWNYTATIRRAVERLGNEAGVRIDYRLPDLDLLPFVVPPTRSYWEAIVELVRFWQPEIYYRRAYNRLLLLDPEAPRYGVGRTLKIGPENLARVDALPVVRNRIRRVILRLE